MASSSALTTPARPAAAPPLRRRFSILRRHPRHVRFGPPRVFAPARGAGPRQTRAGVTRRVIADIAALLT